MDITSLTQFFGWMALINFGFLLFSTIGIWVLGDFAKRTHSAMFGLNRADLGQFYFRYLAQLKLAWIIFNLTPYLALRIIQ